MSLSSLVIPVLLAGVAVCGLGHRADVYGALTHGAEEGLTVLLRVVPALVGLLTAVSMFRASGAMDDLSSLCAPVLERLGIPPETTPLMLIRPVSGSGALAVATELMTTHGPDSFVGRVAAVMLGSTETTFYTIAVYYGSSAPATPFPPPLPQTSRDFLSLRWRCGCFSAERENRPDKMSGRSLILPP